MYYSPHFDCSLLSLHDHIPGTVPVYLGPAEDFRQLLPDPMAAIFVHDFNYSATELAGSSSHTSLAPFYHHLTIVILMKLCPSFWINYYTNISDLSNTNYFYPILFLYNLFITHMSLQAICWGWHKTRRRTNYTDPGDILFPGEVTPLRAYFYMYLSSFLYPTKNSGPNLFLLLLIPNTISQLSYLLMRIFFYQLQPSSGRNISSTNQLLSPKPGIVACVNGRYRHNPIPPYTMSHATIDCCRSSTAWYIIRTLPIYSAPYQYRLQQYDRCKTVPCLCPESMAICTIRSSIVCVVEIIFLRFLHLIYVFCSKICYWEESNVFGIWFKIFHC